MLFHLWDSLQVNFYYKVPTCFSVHVFLNLFGNQQKSQIIVQLSCLDVEIYTLDGTKTLLNSRNFQLSPPKC